MTTIISIDIDRTLVDRETSNHSVAPEVMATVEAVSRFPGVSIVFNTGRDLFALEEFTRTFRFASDSIFLSGRGLKLDEKVLVRHDSVLPLQVVDIALRELENSCVPFIDIKDGEGVLEIRGLDSKETIPFGLQKPPKWYNTTSPFMLNLDHSDLAMTISKRRPIRLELPLLLSDRKHPLIEAFHNKSTSEILTYFELGHNYYVGFHFPNRQHHYLGSPIGFVQILSPETLHNKGTGLSWYRNFKGASKSRIIHIGDSNSLHNNDAVVADIIEESKLFLVDSPNQLAMNESLANEIINYLSTKG